MAIFMKEQEMPVMEWTPVSTAHFKAIYELMMFSAIKLIEKFSDSEDLLDEDGYPTDVALKMISVWPWTDISGLFEFISGLWWMPSFGWHQLESGQGTEYHLSTGGWSGNESLIFALEKNNIAWNFAWQESRRGGHYVFRISNHEYS